MKISVKVLDQVATVIGFVENGKEVVLVVGSLVAKIAEAFDLMQVCGIFPDVFSFISDFPAKSLRLNE